MVDPEATPWRAFALDKLTRILGADAGGRVLRDAMARAHVTELATPDDLYAVSEVIARADGVTAAIGRMIGLHAIMNGARGTAK